jgi:hypothetical protein
LTRFKLQIPVIKVIVNLISRDPASMVFIGELRTGWLTV